MKVFHFSFSFGAASLSDGLLVGKFCLVEDTISKIVLNLFAH